VSCVLGNAQSTESAERVVGRNCQEGRRGWLILAQGIRKEEGVLLYSSAIDILELLRPSLDFLGEGLVRMWEYVCERM
jgi:hypothetical protein